jgi:sugar/nucleoside kinase (ribokinase family)
VILVFGTVCLDRVMQVPHLPAPGGYVGIDREDLYLGGEGANTANALKTWGADVTLIGNDLGTGYEGDLLRQLVANHDLSYRDDDPSGLAPVCDIYVTPDGERTMFGRGFDHMEPAIRLSDIPFRSGQWLSAEPNMSDISREVAREAKARGMKLYLMDFFRDSEPLGPGDFWQCSTDWVGTRGDAAANIRWVEGWVQRTGCFAILTDGSHGLVCGSPDRPVRHYEALLSPKVVDSTGAGDTFRAGMLYGLDLGWDVDRCLTFASAAGALACGYPGATSRVPTVAEIEAAIAGRRLTAS